MSTVSSFSALLASFIPLMTAPTFENLKLIASGWVLSTGKRTVTAIIGRAGAVGTKDHSAFHRFFSRARWSLDEVSHVLLGVLLQFVPQDETVYLAVDDTLCRKRGLKIFGACMHHDPLLSCRKVRLVNWGHSWVVLGILLRFPFAPQTYWCLPFAFRRIHITIVRDPTRVTPDQAFYTTDLRTKALETLSRYAARWSIETAFQNAKSHFGFEDPQNRTQPAVERTAPMGMVFYSLLVIWFAQSGHKSCKFPDRPWYRSKLHASFLDMVVTIKRESLREHFSKDPLLRRRSRKILRLFDQSLRPTA